MILTRFSFDDALFNGTLFDGEMVVDNNKTWIFIVNDLFGHNATHLENVNIVKRLNMLYSIFDSQYKRDDFDVCHFQVKKYFNYSEIDMLLNDFIPNLKYNCRGVYFKPLFLKFTDILINFDDSLVKKVYRKKFSESQGFLSNEDMDKIKNDTSAKPQSSLPRISSQPNLMYRLFWVRKTNLPDVFIIIDLETRKEEMACVPSMKVSKFLREVFLEKNANEKVTMKCERSEMFDRWIPIKVVD